jgi:TonB family protein
VFREDSDMKNRELFQCLSEGEAPKAALGASVGVHGVLLVVLILVPLLAPQTLHVNYRATILAPPPPRPKPIKSIELKLPPRRAAKPIQPAPELISERIPPPPPPPKIALREPEIRTAAPVPTPAAPIATPVLEPKPMPALAVPKPPVVTNVFSSVTLPAATSAPVRNTETAGFAETKPARDGVDGGKSRAGLLGVVGGFDGGVAGGVVGGVRGGTRGTVTAAGFAAPAEAPKTAANHSQQVAEPRHEKPVDILSKPRPDYTEEARKMRIEGEVLLRVLFASSGEARVLEVLRGLSHGLNENAIRAAGQIRFKPAERAGQPIDSTAVVHIVFQLAY